MRSFDLKKISGALASLADWRVDARDEWLKVGMAIHAGANGHDEGLELWDSWSQSSCKYKDGECERLWSGFTADGGIKVGTLFYLAEQDKQNSSKNINTGDEDKMNSETIEKINMEFNDADECIEYLEKQYGCPSIIYKYEDINHIIIGKILRWDNGGNKIIRPISQKPNGKWAIGGMPSPRPLYRLPQILSSDSSSVIFVVEGEKTAEALVSLGLNATTSAHGAQSAAQTDWSPLAGNDVIILPDNDDSGFKYADDVSEILQNLNPPANIKVVELPDLPSGGDAADWIPVRTAAGKNLDEIRGEIENLVEATTFESAPHAPEVLTWKPFPLEVFPKKIQEFIITASESMQVDSSYLALPLLVAAGAAIGNSRRIQLKEGWCEPHILWGGIVGESGSTKSSALKLTTKPCFDKDLKSQSDFKQAFNFYKENSLADNTTKLQKPCPSERFLVSDITVEALADRLQYSPRGILVACDELAGWVKSFDAYKNGRGGDMEKWITFYDGANLIVDRKTCDVPPICVRNAAVSVIGTLQPDTLSRLFSPSMFENGFAERFLLVFPPSRSRKWTDSGIGSDTTKQLQDLFDKLYSLLPCGLCGGGMDSTIVKLESNAKKLFIDFYNQLPTETSHFHSQADRIVASKFIGVAGRLALIISCVRWAAGEIENPNLCDEISMNAGIALARWFLNENCRIYRTLFESITQTNQYRLTEVISRKGGSITPRDLQRNHRSKFATSEAATEALDNLARQRLGYWDINKPTTGRTSRVFRLNY